MVTGPPCSARPSLLPTGYTAVPPSPQPGKPRTVQADGTSLSGELRTHGRGQGGLVMGDEDGVCSGGQGRLGGGILADVAS